MMTNQQTIRFRKWRRAGYAIFASLHRQVTIGTLAVGMSAILLNTVTPAQAKSHIMFSESADSLDEVAIEQVEVRGNQVVAVRSASSSNTVYHRQASAPLQTIESVLRLTPAVDVRERGGRGTQADIQIRGGSFDQTMMMLNGINFTDARTGHQSHQLPIDLDCVGDIHLLGGLPGVGAYAGALDVRTAPLRPKYLRLDLAGGGDGYAYGNLSGAARTPDGRFSAFAAASYRRSDGYRYNTDFDNYNAYTRLNWNSKHAGFFDLQAGFQDRGWGSNGFYAAYNPDQWEHTQTVLTSLRWVKDVGGGVVLRASANYRQNLDRYDWTRGTAMNYHDTDNAGAELWADYTWIAGVTSLGVDYTYNHIYSTNLGEKLAIPHGKNDRYTHADERGVVNAWLRHVKQWRRRGHVFDVEGTGGISVTPYGTAALWNVSGGWGYRGFGVEIGAAQSMRLPTFTDLYYTSPAQLNNPDLNPERAVTYHVEGNFARNRWSASVYGFYRSGRNVIDWVWREEIQKWRCEQDSKLDTFGAEFTGAYTLPSGFFRSISLSYGYLNSSKVGNVVTSSVLDYMRNKAAASVEVRFLRNVSLVLTGSFYDRDGQYVDYTKNADGSVTTSFKPYALLDGRVAWQKGMWKVYFDAMNITDTRYFDFGGMPLPGIWLSGGVVITI